MMYTPLTYEEGIQKMSRQWHKEEQYVRDIIEYKPYKIYTIRSFGNEFQPYNYVDLYGCLDKHGYWWWQVQSGVPSQDFSEENYKFACLVTRLKFCPPNLFGEILDKFYTDGILLVEFIKSRTE